MGQSWTTDELVQAKKEIKKETTQYWYMCTPNHVNSPCFSLHSLRESHKTQLKFLSFPCYCCYFLFFIFFTSSDILSVINTCAQNHSQGRAGIPVQLACWLSLSEVPVKGERQGDGIRCAGLIRSAGTGRTLAFCFPWGKTKHFRKGLDDKRLRILETHSAQKYWDEIQGT